LAALTDLLTPSKRPALIDDACSVLDQEVADKGGLSGLAVKGAYKLLQNIKPGFVREVVDGLLDEFVACIEPIRAEAVSQNAGVGAHMRANPARVADALLAVTDRRAQRAQRAAVRATYEKLRPSAKKHVEAAVPRLAAMVDRHAT
jgi:hypothetical protein